MADRYWVGNGGDWSDDDNHWATSSGGSPGNGNLPTSSDDVIIDENSFSTTGQKITVTIADAICKNFTAANSNAPKIDVSSAEVHIYGNILMDGVVTFTHLGSIEIWGSSDATITVNGSHKIGQCDIDLVNTWKTVTLGSDLDMDGGDDGADGAIGYGNGTLDLNDYNLTNCRTLSMPTNGLYLRSGTHDVMFIGGGGSISAGTSTVNITGESEGRVTANDGEKTFNILNILIDVTFNVSTSNPSNLNAAQVTFAPGVHVTYHEGLTYTFDEIIVHGATFVSENPGNAYTISSDNVSLPGLNVTDCTAAGSAIPFTVVGGYDGGRNTNFIFPRGGGALWLAGD